MAGAATGVGLGKQQEGVPGARVIRGHRPSRCAVDRPFRRSIPKDAAPSSSVGFLVLSRAWRFSAERGAMPRADGLADAAVAVAAQPLGEAAMDAAGPQRSAVDETGV